MAMDAAPALKRKGAEAGAPEPWLLHGEPVPPTKIRRLDAEVPPVVLPGVGVSPPPSQQQQPLGVEEVLVCGDESAQAAAVGVAPVLKRKGAEAPEPWLLDAVPATKIRRLDAEVPPVSLHGAGVPPPPQVLQHSGLEEALVFGDASAQAAAAGVAPAANDERAIVVYQPAEAARNLLLGPLRPGVSLRIYPDWIHGLNSTVLQEASNHRALFEKLAAGNENPNLAMVPWAPAQDQAQAASTSVASGAEMMDADQDGDGASMEVEQDAPPAGVALQGEAFQQHQQQWPPQQCMAAQQLQLPAASYQPSPVTGSL